VDYSPPTCTVVLLGLTERIQTWTWLTNFSIYLLTSLAPPYIIPVHSSSHTSITSSMLIYNIGVSVQSRSLMVMEVMLVNSCYQYKIIAIPSAGNMAT